MFNLSTDEKVLSLTNHLSLFSSILMKNTDNKSVKSLNIYCSNALPFYLYTSRSARLDTFIRIQRKPMEHTRRLKISLFLCLYEAASISHLNSFAVGQRVSVATSACAARTYCVESPNTFISPNQCGCSIAYCSSRKLISFCLRSLPHPMKKDLI